MDHMHNSGTISCDPKPNKVVQELKSDAPIKESCATRSLYANSGPKAKGVPTYNHMGRGSGLCRLRGG